MNFGKVSLFCVVLFMTTSGLIAQVELGLRLGLNLSKVAYSNSFDEEMVDLSQQVDLATGLHVDLVDVAYKPGIHVGLYAMKEWHRLSVQADLLYSRKGTRGYAPETDVNLNYFSVPVMVGYHLVPRIKLELGPQAGFLLGNKIKQSEFPDREVEDYFKKFDLAAGAGLQYQNFGKVKFKISARYLYGLTDVLERDVEFSNLSGRDESFNLRNRTIQLSLVIPLFNAHRGYGCPTFEEEVDLGKKAKKAKSGLLPKNGKKYIKKNSKRLK